MSSTDEPCDGAVRVGTVFTRYHVCAPSVGLVDSYRRQAEAFEAAGRFANKNGETVEVFDSMARLGAGDLWEFYPSPDGGLATWKAPKRHRAV